jgi:energy-converting hydrogenase A subunit M
VNDDLKKFLATHYKEGKSDLCTSFILRNFDYLLPHGYNAMVTMQSWMFLSSFEDLRKKIVDEKTILCLVQMTNGVMKIAFGTSAFVIKNQENPNYKGHYSYVQLEDIRPPDKSQNIHFEHPYTFPIPNERLATASSSDFHKIPGSPIAYWVSPRIRQIFTECEPLGSVADARQGLATADNNRFLRLWQETSYGKIGFGMHNRDEAFESKQKWFPYNKGGDFRKWYGNQEYTISFDEESFNILKNVGNHCPSREFYFKESVSWSDVTSSGNSFRYFPKGIIFSHKGNCIFFALDFSLLSFLNINFISKMTKVLNPTVSFPVGYLNILPYATKHFNPTTESIAKHCIELAQTDWDAYERSWNFARLPLLLPEYQRDTIEETYKAVRWHWHEMTYEMHKLEVQNNKLFNEAYELEDEISSDVPMQEITLTCNPAYRYPDTRSSQRSTEEKEALLLEDTMKEYISYFVGCLFGRYSLNKDGLVLANQGDTLQNYLDVIPSPTFTPDENNVVPILDDYWFQDDIVNRFYEFTKVAFGKEHISTNINYIENVLKKSIRQYFIKDFYKDHVQTYKKRPIYWLFSSEKGAFQALIYMHRYTKDTPSIVLRYLRDYISKLNTKIEELQKREIDASISAAEQNKAKKQIEQLQKTLKELHTYEKDVLYPLATKRIEIDLDDGVKHNYPLLGKSLKKIPGLSE